MIPEYFHTKELTMRSPLWLCLTVRNGCAKAIGLCLILFMSLPFAHADTYTVTNLTDSGAGSLRQAVLDANANTDPDNTIVFQSGLSGQLFTQGRLRITTGTVDIVGPGAEVLTIIGNGVQRIFEISSGATATLSGLTLTNGGGGILNNGTLTVTHSTLSGNTAASNGSGGAIYNAGSGAMLTVVDSLLTNNSAGNGGGLYNSSATLILSDSTLSGNNSVSPGGGISNTNNGSVTITNTTLSGNVAGSFGGGVSSTTGTLTVTRTALTDNSAAYHGGGIYFSGNSGRVTVSESTLSNNSTGTLYCGGGMNIAGGSSGTATVVLHNNTLSGNTARDGGGLCISNATTHFFNNTVSDNTATRNGGGISIGVGGILNIGNSLITGNSAVSGKSIYGSSGLFSQGHNLFGENGIAELAGGITASANDLTLAGSVNTAIDSLADNGGPTKTHALATGSPAINAGNNALIPASVTTDQRGTPRIHNNIVDIGAVEAGAAITTYTVTASAGANGRIDPASQPVAPGATTILSVIPDPGYVATVAGCNGTLVETLYTTGPVNAPCQVVATFAPTPTASAPVLTTPVLPDAIAGVPYAALLTAISGQYPYTYAATGLPSGLTLTADGIVRGTPTTGGAFVVTATVTDALARSSTRRYAMTVGTSLALLTADLPDALINVPYTQTLAALGGQPPYIFTATGLPAGFSLSPSGALRGTPLEPGHAAVQLTVTDATNRQATQTTPLTVRDATFSQPNPEQPEQTIEGAAESCPTANIATRTLKLGDPGAPTTGPDGVALLYGLLEIKVTGCQPGQTVLALTTVYPEPLPPDAQYWKYGRTRSNPEPHWYVLPGAIIEGNAITLLIVDGDIGDSDLDVDGNILDPGGPGITLNTIDGAVPAVLPISEPYRVDFQARCDQGRCPANSAYDWSLAAGVLPDGLTLTGNGATATLSGTPTRQGRYTFTVQVLARGDSPTPTQQSYTVRISDGSPDPAATTLITHYYVSILEREPDADGLAYWQGLIAEREAQKIDIKPVFQDMANFFFNSPEYLGRNTTDRQFITNLYLTFFQREPDEGGYAFWLEQLAKGMARNDAMAGFLYSQEFTDFMQGLGF
jgi:hypothetical protein